MSEKVTGKPLPEISDLTRPFWNAARDGKLVMQRCNNCGTVNFPAKPWCVACGSRDIPWTDMKPTGTVYSYTVSRVVAMNYPDWASELPMVLCLVDVDDGARLYAQLTDCNPDDVMIGMRVEAHFETISEDAGVPKFRPLTS
tara:strand:+ start:80 stop:505 length:426 start_codon:yes stop_codon:yes gene_type:complete